jgi:gamma-glutamyl:cysteine ligase YbdK (ATP-grasp superfamily)
MEGGGVAEADAGTAVATPLRAFEAVGLELEYMLVDRATLDVRPMADLVLQRMQGEAGPAVTDVARGTLGWSNELVLHLLELKNPRPAADLARLAGRFQAEIAAAQPLLREFGARLMPGGMHPWMDPRAETELWPHDGQAIYAAYDRVFDCRRHGWANVQAMHVNLPFADDAEFERVHAAVRALLPLVPALAASSPFADGRAAGTLDTRMEAYRTNATRVPALTGRVVPDNYASRAAYQTTLLQPIYAAIAEHDPGELLRHEWLNARGAIARFDRNAIELRVADVQEHPGVDVALAALVADAAEWLYREAGPPLAAQQALATDALADVFEACIRDADRATVAYRPLLRLFGLQAEQCAAADLWHAIAARLDGAPARHAALWRGSVERLLRHGPLARRLLAAAGPAPDRAALAAVYRELCDCLEDGRDFLP